MFFYLVPNPENGNIYGNQHIFISIGISSFPNFPSCYWQQNVYRWYWLRLCHGTSNVLLNAAFKSACDIELTWLQSIKYLLTHKGFGNVFLDPMPIAPNFGKTFVQRSNDQFQQTRKSNMHASRFVFLNQCKNEYERGAYLSVIKTHEIFTRLQVDMNILASCRYRQPSAPVCPMCQAGVEDKEHFILVCPTWHHLRNEFFRWVKVFSPSFPMASNLEKINNIQDLTCPSEAISHYCAYVKRIYDGRQKSCPD